MITQLAKTKFNRHKAQSKFREIEFNFTLEDWYNWWLSNGVDKNLDIKWPNNTRPCMCRFNDTGPYELSNVYFATHAENSSHRKNNPLNKQTKKGIEMKPSTRKLYTQIGNYLFKAERLTRDIQIDPATNCHVWTGANHRQGYGMMGYTNATTESHGMTVVHRLAMMHHLGRELDSQEFVIHSCDNQKCINPDHLILGNAAKRYEVMVQKGHQNPSTGHRKVRGVEVKQNRNYRYSEEEIRWVRQASVPDIAARFNIDRVRAANMRWGMRNGFKWLK